MQNKPCQNFIKEFLPKYVFIKQACKEFVMDYWPDDPPWTSLFGDIGFSICENWNGLSVEEKSHIFETIESALCESMDDYLENAIKTGLLEAIIHFTDKDENLLVDIESYMLPISKEFASAYKNATF